jgi:cytochrome c-type biogenesis protein CcmE
MVTDGKAKVPVAFSGVAPDLFKEGSGVVAEGSFNADGSFTATNLLAKHDERYMPPQVAGKMHETETLNNDSRSRTRGLVAGGGARARPADARLGRGEASRERQCRVTQ